MNFFSRSLAGLILLVSGGALATTFMPTPFPDKVDDAPSIVRGTAGNSTSDWGIGRDGVKRIYTYTELSPKEVIKQGPGEAIPMNTIKIRELGGTKDGMGMEVSGTAHFNRGEDVVVMLGDRTGDGAFEVRGMMMGKFNIERDSQGREVLTGPGLDESGTDAFDAHGHGHGHGSGKGQTGTVWTLDRLRTLVKERQQAQQKMAEAAPKTMTSPGVEAQPAVNQVGAPALQPQGLSPGPEGSSSEQEGPGGQALLWGLGLVAALGGFGLWMALRSRR